MTTTKKRPQADDAVKAGRRARDGKATPIICDPRAEDDEDYMQSERVDDSGSSQAAPDPNSPEAHWLEALNRARSEIQAVMATTAAALSAPIDFVSFAELIDRATPPTSWLVGGLITNGAVATISGEPKTAKTWLAIELAVSVALGREALGEFAVTEPRGVALFLTEDHEGNVRARLRGTVRGHGIDDDDARALPIYVKARGSLDLANVEQLAWLVASVRSLADPVALVVIDPLRNVHSLKEDSSDDMAIINRHLRTVRDVLGATVLYVHHAGKSTEQNAHRRPGQRMRGSSALHGGYDAGIHLFHPAETIEGDITVRTASVTSDVKAGRGAGDFSFTLRIHDDDNRQCVRADWEHSAETKAAKARTTSPDTDAKLVLAVFSRPDAAQRMSKNQLAIAAGGTKQARLRLIDEMVADGRLSGEVKGSALVVSLPSARSGSTFDPKKGSNVEPALPDAFPNESEPVERVEPAETFEVRGRSSNVSNVSAAQSPERWPGVPWA